MAQPPDDVYRSFGRDLGRWKRNGHIYFLHHQDPEDPVQHVGRKLGLFGFPHDVLHGTTHDRQLLPRDLGFRTHFLRDLCHDRFTHGIRVHLVDDSDRLRSLQRHRQGIIRQTDDS